MKRSTNIIREQTVPSFDGSLKPLDRCRKIKGDFYEEGTQCFLINEKWYRINCGMISKRLDTGLWALISDLKKQPGMVEFLADVENGKPVFGFAKSVPKLWSYVITGDETKYPAWDIEELLNKKKIEFFIGFPYPSIPSAKVFGGNISYDNGRYDYPEAGSEVYSVKNSPFAKKVEKENFPMSVSPKMSELSKFIHYTFGVEYESSRGIVTIYDLFKYKLVPLRDGSTQNKEFSTIPLSGGDGLQRTIDFCKNNLSRMSVNENCALHVHYGGVRKDKEYVVALYILALMIEKEIRSLTMPLRRSHIFLSKKRKDHQQDLPIFEPSYLFGKININKTYDQLYKFLTDGYTKSTCDEDFGGLHPRVNNAKYSILNRYYWLNLLPALLQDGKTYELRSFHASFHPHIVLSWILVGNALLKFTEMHKNSILNGNTFRLHDVIQGYKSNFGEGTDGTHVYESLREFCEHQVMDFANVEGYYNPHNVGSALGNLAWEPRKKLFE